MSMSKRSWKSFSFSFLHSSFSRKTPGIPGKYRTFPFLIRKSSKSGLLQRHNFPLHFLGRTKTPFKWMAFAHSLRPQLAALLPTPIHRSQNGGWGGDGAGRGMTQQVRTWNNCNYCSSCLLAAQSDLTSCWFTFFSLFFYLALMLSVTSKKPEGVSHTTGPLQHFV